MAFELKEGQGTFFRNDKQGNDARPDYRGELLIGGTLHEISGWVKEGKRGKWMSLSAKPKTAGPRREREPGSDDDLAPPF